MTQVEQLGALASGASYDAFSRNACEDLKIRLIDSLGCAVGALVAKPIKIIRYQIHEFNGSGLCTCIGGGTRGWQDVGKKLGGFESALSRLGVLGSAVLERTPKLARRPKVYLTNW